MKSKTEFQIQKKKGFKLFVFGLLIFAIATIYSSLHYLYPSPENIDFRGEYNVSERSDFTIFFILIIVSLIGGLFVLSGTSKMKKKKEWIWTTISAIIMIIIIAVIPYKGKSSFAEQKKLILSNKECIETKAIIIEVDNNILSDYLYLKIKGSNMSPPLPLTVISLPDDFGITSDNFSVNDTLFIIQSIEYPNIFEIRNSEGIDILEMIYK